MREKGFITRGGGVRRWGRGAEWSIMRVDIAVAIYSSITVNCKGSVVR